MVTTNESEVLCSMCEHPVRGHDRFVGCEAGVEVAFEEGRDVGQRMVRCECMKDVSEEEYQDFVVRQLG